MDKKEWEDISNKIKSYFLFLGKDNLNLELKSNAAGEYYLDLEILYLYELQNKDICIIIWKKLNTDLYQKFIKDYSDVIMNAYYYTLSCEFYCSKNTTRISQLIGDLFLYA